MPSREKKVNARVFILFSSFSRFFFLFIFCFGLQRPLFFQFTSTLAEDYHLLRLKRVRKRCACMLSWPHKNGETKKSE